MGSGLRDRGVWWGILRGRLMVVCLFEFAARVEKKNNSREEDDSFLTHTYMNLDFSRRHGRFHKRRTRLRYD